MRSFLDKINKAQRMGMSGEDHIVYFQNGEISGVVLATPFLLLSDKSFKDFTKALTEIWQDCVIQVCGTPNVVKFED